MFFSPREGRAKSSACIQDDVSIQDDVVGQEFVLTCRRPEGSAIFFCICSMLSISFPLHFLSFSLHVFDNIARKFLEILSNFFEIPRNSQDLFGKFLEIPRNF